MHVSLTKPEIEEFVLAQVGQGRFATVDEAVESLLAQLMRVVGVLDEQAVRHTDRQALDEPTVSEAATAPAPCPQALPALATPGHVAVPSIATSIATSPVTASPAATSPAAVVPRDDDEILINGSADDLRIFAEDPRKSIILANDTDEVGLMSAIASHLPGQHQIQYMWSPEYDKLTLAWKTRRAVLTLTLVPQQDCDTIVRGFNALLAGEYEIRVFRHTLLLAEDRSLLLRPAQWWAEVNACFAKRFATIFAPIDDEVVLL